MMVGDMADGSAEQSVCEWAVVKAALLVVDLVERKAAC